MVKYIEVRGGYMSSSDSKDANASNSKDSGVFMEKVNVVIREEDLGGLMRRDWELCSMPVIKIRKTSSRPRNELPVRY
jgi:hypothetical protein